MTETKGSRIHSIDRLRGLVMVLMAIDHVRDFVGPDVSFRGIDVARTGPALFLTRWITHFCAPVFVLLAGTSVGLMLQSGKNVAYARRFLVTRGLFLALLEITIVRFAWGFELTYHSTFLGVIWVLGWSMVLLALVVGLAPRAVLAIGLVIVFGHDALDSLHADSMGGFGPVFSLLHEPHRYTLVRGIDVFVLYPILPWAGVMAVGFGLAPIFRRSPSVRDRALVQVGLAAIAIFVVFRMVLDVYADPHPWSAQRTPMLTFLAMLDCQKYPPSLAYLTMTLGPAMLALVLLERLPARLAEPLEWLGSAPLFYYVLHLYLAHAGALVLYYAVYGEHAYGFAANPELRPHFSLAVVYAATAFVVLALTPACRWFGDLKKRRRDLTILSYL